MSKIGRNDPCFCGSGKKYKFCCMGTEERLRPTAELPLPTVAESFALRLLLAGSREFQAFYTAERPTISDPIHWTSQALLPGNIAGQAIRLPNELQLIYLRRIPAAPPDAALVAQQLMQFVLDTQGFPLVLALTEHQSLAALLNVLLREPLIERRLQPYGLGNGTQVRREIPQTLNELQRAERPTDHIVRLHWILTYSGRILSWRAAQARYPDLDIAPFEAWFTAQQPEIAAEGRKLLALVARLGYETPEHMRAILQRLLANYDLADKLVIRTRGEAAHMEASSRDQER